MDFDDTMRENRLLRERERAGRRPLTAAERVEWLESRVKGWGVAAVVGAGLVALVFLWPEPPASNAVQDVAARAVHSMARVYSVGFEMWAVVMLSISCGRRVSAQRSARMTEGTARD